MSAAVTTPQAGDERWRKVNELACAVVVGVYRIVKGCTLFDSKNDVTDQQARALAQSVSEYCSAADVDMVGITFAMNTIFVEGQVMRSSRETYYLALELGEILGAHNVNEMVFDKTVVHDSIEEWARLLTKAFKDENVAAELLVPKRFRGLQCANRNIADWFNSNANDSPSERAARLFATAVVALRSTNAEFGAGKFKLSPRLKRIARRIVFELERSPLELTALALSARGVDPAVHAIATAIIAANMALKATRGRAEPTLAAVVAMLSHAGRYRLLRGDINERQLGDDELDRLPANSTIALIQLGKLYPAARQWSTLTFEALWTTRAHRMGKVYRGRRSPLMLSRLIATARALVELLSTSMGKAALPPDQALHLLLERATDKTSRALARLAIGAVGLFPAGTLVELNTREIAVVVGVPERAIGYSQPRIRIVFTAEGSVCTPPLEVDLAKQKKGSVTRHVRSLFHASDAQTAALKRFIDEARSQSALRPWEEIPFAAISAATIAGAEAAHVPPAMPAMAFRETVLTSKEAPAATPAPAPARPVSMPTAHEFAPAVQVDPATAPLQVVADSAPPPPAPLPSAPPPPPAAAAVATRVADARARAGGERERTVLGLAPNANATRSQLAMHAVKAGAADVAKAEADAALKAAETSKAEAERAAQAAKAAPPPPKPAPAGAAIPRGGEARFPKRTVSYNDERQAPKRSVAMAEPTRLGIAPPPSAPTPEKKKATLDALLAGYMEPTRPPNAPAREAAATAPSVDLDAPAPPAAEEVEEPGGGERPTLPARDPRTE